ncbi:hypothetical protein M0P65_05300 [Candidatus Gracilibacteria bacterium]|nr:hypothetical protein [Candidatus Gracilibacteria bacterium]
MARQSLEESILQAMGRIAFTLFTTDDDFKKAKTLEELCGVLKRRSNNAIETTPPTVLKMILGWIAGNKCPASEFADIIKVSQEGKGKKGKASFRETLEDHYKKSIWEVFKEKLSNCETPSEACAVLAKDSKNKIQVGEVTFCKTIEAGKEANEFQNDSFWVSWLPKRRHHKTPEEQEQVNKEEGEFISTNISCQKCNTKSKRQVKLYEKHRCLIGIRANRCHGCQSWGTSIVEFEINGHKIKKACVTTKDGCVIEEFVDDDLNIIQNPLIVKRK